jgi:hypothetical protein
MNEDYDLQFISNITTTTPPPQPQPQDDYSSSIEKKKDTTAIDYNNNKSSILKYEPSSSSSSSPRSSQSQYFNSIDEYSKVNHQINYLLNSNESIYDRHDQLTSNSSSLCQQESTFNNYNESLVSFETFTIPDSKDLFIDLIEPTHKRCYHESQCESSDLFLLKDVNKKFKLEKNLSSSKDDDEDNLLFLNKNKKKSSFSSSSTSYLSLIEKIFNEIELNRPKIRKADSIPSIEQHLNDLIESISNLIEQSMITLSSSHQKLRKLNKLKTKNNFQQSTNNNNSFPIQNQTKKNQRLLVIAYIYLIEVVNNKISIFTSFPLTLSQYEIKLISLLENIYADLESPYHYGEESMNIKTKISNDNNNNKSNNSLTAIKTTCSSSIKKIHFLLFLFTSFVKFETVIEMTFDSCPISNYNNSNLSDLNNASINRFNFDAILCQKVLLQLIDQMCLDNKFLKTRILLSIAEFNLI